MLRIVFFKIFIVTISFLGMMACQQQSQQQLPYYNTPDFTPHFISNPDDVERKITHQIGAFSFTNQHHQIVTAENIKGKIHVANFIFTSCGSICPVMTKNMYKVYEAFKDDEQFAILSYSVTPWIDSVPRLKKYAAQNNITSKNWHLLTGDKVKIYDLARKSYFAEEDLGFTKDSSDFLHTEHFVLVDASQRIRGIYNGTLPLEITQLINDIKTLKKGEE